MAYTTIDKPSDYFNTKLYTGNGSTQSITGVGFKPDWTWIKPRTGSYSHNLTDIVRGVGKGIFADLLSVEYNYGTGTDGSVRTFDSDGFSLGSATQVNPNSVNIVSWNWLAGGSQGSSNTDGSINTTYTSVNTTAGFSISQYTGTSGTGTIGHGLGVAPSMIIFKSLNNGNKNWVVYHKSLTNAGSIYFDQNAASSTNYDYFADTSPTASVFTVKKDSSYDEVNNSGTNFIAYAFAEKKGYSKFGKYTGNGNADGTFIYTGFKPAFVIGKRTDATNNWYMYDNKRDTFNPTTQKLRANTTAAEATGTDKLIDMLSNGFKMRSTDAEFNASGGTYIYLAFAENPFVTGASAIPTHAR